MKTLTIKVESTGEQLGTVSWDGKKVESDASAATEMIGSQRRRGLSDSQIWEQLDGWSNGYLSMRESEGDNGPAAQPGKEKT